MTRQNPHILLVNPWIHDFAAYDVWAKPLGLLTIGGILRHYRFDITYIDCLDRFHPKASLDIRSRFGRGPYLKTPIPKPSGFEDVPRRFSRYGIRPEWFREELLSVSKPDLILVTSIMTYWWPGVRETISTIKEVFQKIPVILGGVYATLCREHAVQNSGADQVISGSCEDRIGELVSGLTGVPYGPDNRFKPFDPDDLDTYPLPIHDLQRRIPYVPLLTSVGCPFSCAYCAAHFLTRKRMRKSPSRVLEEIRYWNRTYGVSDFALYDDAFLIDAENHASPILERIIDSGLKVRIHTPNALHVREVSISIAKQLYRAGFETIRLGLETTQFNGRELLDRKVGEEEFIGAASYLLEAGFQKKQVGAYLLAGLPGQSMADVEVSIRNVKKCGIQPVLAYYSPIPHTALWKKAVLSSRYPLESDPVFTNNAVFPCRKKPFSWEKMSRLKRLASGEIE
ncbi:MAG: radical SAM protein [Pseudomonadota bacterium]